MGDLSTEKRKYEPVVRNRELTASLSAVSVAFNTKNLTTFLGFSTASNVNTNLSVDASSAFQIIRTANQNSKDFTEGMFCDALQKAAALLKADAESSYRRRLFWKWDITSVRHNRYLASISDLSTQSFSDICATLDGLNHEHPLLASVKRLANSLKALPTVKNPQLLFDINVDNTIVSKEKPNLLQDQIYQKQIEKLELESSLLASTNKQLLSENSILKNQNQTISQKCEKLEKENKSLLENLQSYLTKVTTPLFDSKKNTNSSLVENSNVKKSNLVNPEEFSTLNKPLNNTDVVNKLHRCNSSSL